MIIIQLVKKFPAFVETGGSIRIGS